MWPGGCRYCSVLLLLLLSILALSCHLQAGWPVGKCGPAEYTILIPDLDRVTPTPTTSSISVSCSSPWSEADRSGPAPTLLLIGG
ncbi:hypothetical protein BDV11DRAFT_145219 [Aspergillus similis]